MRSPTIPLPNSSQHNFSMNPIVVGVGGPSISSNAGTSSTDVGTT